MKSSIDNAKSRYRILLRRSLADRRLPSAKTTKAFGLQIAKTSLTMRQLTRLHEQIVLNLLPAAKSGSRDGITRSAGRLFAAIATAAGLGKHKPSSLMPHLQAVLGGLSQRAVALAAANAALLKEVDRRKAAETSLAKSQDRHRHMLAKSVSFQGQLKRLSHLLISAQEEERRRISRELHDVIGQTLSGISIRLATLKREARIDSVGFERNIARTQRLVLKSVNIVHQFARDLRPAVLDDLGLIPALESHMQMVSRRSGVRIAMSACTEVKDLSAMRRTILFRVAQEALTNVARHAHATHVDLAITRKDNDIKIVIHDDGRSFHPERILQAKGGKRLGLLGMRERIEMIGGHFDIASNPGSGTTITATIPAGLDLTTKPH